jgi:large conductance mechanosensitive channel
MSSSANEGEIKVSQTEVTVTKTEVSGSANNVENVLVKDISRFGKGALKNLEGFRAVILRGNVVDLAIGIVIGAAFTAVVNALVSDVITPLIPVSKSGNLSTLEFKFCYVDMHIGLFINAIISFVIVAAVLYFFVVQPVNSFMKLYHGKETEAPTTRECPYCYQSVNLKATRCSYCTSLLPTGDKKEKAEETEPVLVLPESLEKLSDKLAESIIRKATTALEKDVASGETIIGKD